MVFSSLLFLFLFLPTSLIVYYSFQSRPARNLILAIFSLIFYAWGEPIWVCLLLISCVVDYLNGLFIDHFKNQPLIARVGLVSSLVVNLGLLGTFKYADFIIQNVNAFLGTQFQLPGILLPIGISFYTFQTISYTVDVYRGEVKAQRNFLNFLLFVVSFHQLVAGPIVRYVHIAREIEERVFAWDDFSAGVSRFCQGLVKKVLIANTAGELCVQFLDKGSADMTQLGTWFGLLMFTLQIYFDFSGYSDMAIGLGRMFGFHYHENFNHPYVARSLTDFWRRWHISLGTFFRDYVYIPLGGNRRHQARNIFIVWGLTGLWHGASWNFILWGLYFGVIMFIEKTWLLAWMARRAAWLQHLYAIFFIMLGWCIFYYTDLNRLQEVMVILFGISNNEWSNYELESAMAGHALWLVLALLLCTPITHLLRLRLKQLMKLAYYEVCIVFLNSSFLIVSVILLVGKSYNPFIYFRF